MPSSAPPTRSRSSTSRRSRCATGSSAGLVYPAERVDAALSNYFRLGNLTALRELALLWLADEVDSALKPLPRRARHRRDVAGARTRRRGAHRRPGRRDAASAAERASPPGRPAASSSPCTCRRQDGLRATTPGALTEQRALVESLGGSYHQVVGDDVPRALVEFARSVNATQLVIGVSRRGRLAAALTGPGIGATVIRESGDIDVHIVTHAAAGGRFALPRITGGALSVKRRVARLRASRSSSDRCCRGSCTASAARSRSPRTSSRTSCSSSSSR